MFDKGPFETYNKIKRKMEKGVIFLAPGPQFRVDEVDNDRDFGGCYHGS